MKISVITVCFNSAATIADTLRSVADQSHPNVEHVIVDGGSRDDTVKLAHTMGRSGRVIITEPDKGIYDAMNKGLRLATGDLVGFLNADDVFATAETLARIADAAQPLSRVDAIYGDLQYVAKDHPGQVVRHWHSGAFWPSRLRFGWMPPHPTLYVRRTVLDAVGEFDINFHISADYDFALRLFSLPGRKFVYLPSVLVLMRTGGASNHSLRALLRKSSEDYRAIRKHKIGGVFTLLSKNFRKLGQLWTLGARRSRHGVSLR